jgi:hypothetical protein
MSGFSDLARMTVEVLSAGTLIEHGNTLPDWAAPSVVVERGWSVQPNQGVELTEGRDAVQATYRGFGPADSSVTATSRIRFKGVAYEVVGEPLRWLVGTDIDHVEVLLNVWTG